MFDPLPIFAPWRENTHSRFSPAVSRFQTVPEINVYANFEGLKSIIMARLNPYLNFNNNCREAMNFYKDVLGGELVLQQVKEMPAMAAQMPAELGDAILHSTLTSGDIVIMASDLHMGKFVEGNTMQLCINCDSENQLNTFFSKLGAGGKIIEPLADMPWGGKYGCLIDKFEKTWIFNFQKS